ncbi:MAG: DNA repair protein RadA [Spirochaetales bacterium]|nr:DNA repair protein RadA [Spirochaetales bacterium]
MSKIKQLFICKSCSHQETKWLGRCPECGEWNTFEESFPGSESSPAETKLLSEIKAAKEERVSCGIGEMDRVLGGGLMPGSAVLLGGEPGIGKSTLIIQTAELSKLKTLYISGEETGKQLRERAGRLGLAGNNIHIVCETNLPVVLKTLEKTAPGLVILDSIQTITDPQTGSVPGTVNQLKICTLSLSRWVKEHNASLICIAHVTKEGTIAGPKLIEHMVDTVLYFDRSEDDTRFLRSIKNRYGATDEIGLFTMTEQGLKEIRDPRFFIEKRQQTLPPGIAFVPVFEGSRVFVVEIQTLLVPAKASFSRIYSDKIETSRVSRIAAVLEKQFSMNFSNQDIYINVAGGIRLTETAIDLALAAALYSGRTDLALPPSWTFCGEISLAGEIRNVAHLQRRMKTASELGFTHLVGPVTDEKGADITLMQSAHVKNAFSLLAKAVTG